MQRLCDVQQTTSAKGMATVVRCERPYRTPVLAEEGCEAGCVRIALMGVTGRWGCVRVVLGRSVVSLAGSMRGTRSQTPPIGMVGLRVTGWGG